LDRCGYKEAKKDNREGMMGKKILTLVSVILVSACIVSCSRQFGSFSGTFTSKNGKFSFEVPEGWKIKKHWKERLIEAVLLGSLEQDSKSKTPEANIWIHFNDGTDTPNSKILLEGLINQQIEGLYKANGYDIVKILTRSDISFKGASGVKLEMLVKTSAPGFEWIEIKTKDYHLFKGDDYYVISFYCFSDLFYYYKGIFTDIFESFEFIL